MAQRKRRGGRRKKQAASKKAITVSNDDLAVARRVTTYHARAILIAVVPQLFILLNREWMVERTGTFTKWVLVFLMPLGFTGVYLTHRYPITSPYTGNPKGVRRRAVFLLALAIFINLVNWVPIIYAYGFLDVLKRIPGREQVGSKLSLAIAFGLGAIVSGVLGNLTYDVLKFTVHKMVRRKR